MVDIFLHIIDGKLKILKNGLLPLLNKQGIHGCHTRGGCSLAGDLRVDENIALLSMHTLWVREHNRIADGLKKLNPKWSNNQLFHTARKIVGGMLQQITYAEYLPFLVKLPKYKKFDERVDPSVFHGFASAAFRYGHSLVPNQFDQLDMGFNKKYNAMSLQDAFRNRNFILSSGIESTMFGLVKNFTRAVDDSFAFALSRRLFVDLGKNVHLDLLALNIQRGRDHGLNGYTEYRRGCRLPEVKDWRSLKRVMVTGAGERLQKIYKHPDDIDLFAGGISEKHASGSIIGPLFSCLISRQFKNLRDGDRFYYENEGVFTPSQLIAIKKVKMSSVLCSTLKGVVSMQPNAFLAGEDKNARRSCASVPKLDLRPWKQA